MLDSDWVFMDTVTKLMVSLCVFVPPFRASASGAGFPFLATVIESNSAEPETASRFYGGFPA
jgi:hypothetical protein